MHARTDIHTPFHIDLLWWRAQGRNFSRFLVEILGTDDIATPSDAVLDYIDPATAEVFQMDPLWVRVLVERAHKPDYISRTTPMTNALLRALVENLNQPMSAMDMHRRINRSNPQTLLRVLQAAHAQYGIVPVADRAAS
jgi:hypothetical protein